MLKKIWDFIVNPLYVKIFFVITSFLLVTSVGRPFVDGIIKFGIIWSAVIFFYDLLTQRRVLKSRGMLLLFGFLAFFAITIVINYQAEFKNNVSVWAYMVCILLVLYPYKGIGKEQALREMTILNYTYLGLTAVTTTISFLLFLEQYTYWGDYFNLKFCIGIYDNRLFGIHLNPGIVLTSVGICLCVLQFFINRKNKGKKQIAANLFLGYTLVMNFVCMALENSKGAFIGMAAFTGLLCAFGAGRLLRNKKLLVKCAAGFGVLIITVGLFWGGVSLARSGLAYLPPLVMDQPIVKQVRERNTEFLTKHGYGTPEWNEPISEDPDTPSHGPKADIERTEIPPDYGMLTGRPIIWKFGLREFAKRPLLGYGPNYHTDVQVLERPLAHFHNLIIQCLVSVGLVGSFFILFFLALQLFYLLKKCLGAKADMIYASVLAFLLMLGINSMAEVTILFLVRPTAFVFWIYLGYLMVLSKGEQEKTSWIDKPFLALDRWLTQKQEFIKNRRAVSHGKK